MRRREFIAGFGGAAAWPLMGQAQQPGKVARIGYMAPTVAYDSADHVFEDAMGRLGWETGRNLRIEYRYLGGRQDNVAPLVAEVIGLDVDATQTALVEQDTVLRADFVLV